MEIIAVADFKVPLFFILPHHLPIFCLFLHFFLDKFKFQSSQGRQMQGTYSFPDRKYDWGNIQLAIQRKHLCLLPIKCIHILFTLKELINFRKRALINGALSNRHSPQHKPIPLHLSPTPVAAPFIHSLTIWQA